MVKTMSSKAQEGISKLKTLLNPKTLLSGKSLLWPLAIDIGWQLFGNDIINILTPALTVLESFAGVVRGVLGTVAPLFAPVVGVLERLAVGLDWVAANMDALAPVIGGAAAALMVFNAKLIAGTIASWAHTAATAISSVTQKVFNTSLLACPLTWIALAIGVVIGLLYRWIQSVGGIRTAWAIVVDEVSYFLDKMDLGFMRTFYGILDYMGDFKVGFLTVFQEVGNGGIDLGGIAKGYTSERALSELEDAGVSSAIVSLGGNVGALGLKPDGSRWTVAIQDPEGDGYIATLELGEDGEKIYAITSGGYQRYFEQDGTRYHHILDPKTGAPAETDLLSVTIVSQDGTLADGLSTALFVKGFDEAVEFWREYHTQFGMVLVTEDGLFATEELSVSSELTVQPLEVTP